MKYFIYSLPRSGSAWLSVFLSGKDSYCFHEPFVDGDPANLYGISILRNEYIIGAIDTSAYFRNDMSVIDCSKFVLIRPISDIKASFAKLGWPSDWDFQLEKFREATSGLTPIYYTRLFDIAYLREIWKQVIGTEFDEERALTLIEMNIQRDWKAVKRRYVAAHS